MQYTLLLERISEHKDIKKPNSDKLEDSTIGQITLTDTDGKEHFKCFCCENIGPSTNTPKQDKRILPGVYYLEWTDTTKNQGLVKQYPKFKLQNNRNKAIWLKSSSLEGFEKRRILIHTGNYPQDTEGCLLFGYNTSNGTISSSAVCIKDFYELVETIGIDNITLEIKEIEWK